MSKQINGFLTPATHAMLKALRDGEDHYAISEGLEVWVDNRRFSWPTLNKLLRLCLVKMEPGSSLEVKQSQIWYLNEEGVKIIDDVDYVPLIVKAQAAPPAAKNSEE